MRARAAEHGLGANELKALVRGRARAPELPDARLVSDELAGAAGLTERQNTFARREAVMAWAAAHSQGASAALVEDAAAQFLRRPDVQRAPDRSEARFTTSDLIAHEHAIVRGAQARRGEGSGRVERALVDEVLVTAPYAPTDEQATVVRALTSSGHGVDSVEALAGTGKTFTAGLLARAYGAAGFRVLGTAPTARAVRELQDEAGIARAWTLTRLALDLDADPASFGTEPAVLIADEAGMAGTRETARVLEHAAAAGVKVIAIGDSGQLSSVQAGGWLGSLSRRLGSYELREVMRQRDPRERALLAHVRRGDPSDYLTEKAARAQLHVFTGDPETGAAAERAAIAAWREHQAASPSGQAVLITRDNVRRRRLNAFARAELGREGRLGESVHVAGQEFAVGDRVIARHNDRLRAVDNGMRGTIIAVDPTEKELIVRTDAGADRALDAAYVAEHLEHAYALTAHTIQGGTVEWAGVVGHPDDFTRNWSYTALSRARDATEIFLIDTPTERQLDRAEIAPHHPKELGDERTPRERLEAAMRRRDDDDLALDRIDGIAGPAAFQPSPCEDAHAGTDQAPRSMDELRSELAQLREHLARPDELAVKSRAARDARTEAARLVDEARARISELEALPRGRLRRRTQVDATLGFERERLRAAEEQLTAAIASERDLAAQVRDHAMPGAERDQLRSRAADLERRLPGLRDQHLRAALERPEPYLTAALGTLPEDPRARATWHEAARHVEAYRFDHAIADTEIALGPRPNGPEARAAWHRATRALQHAQRELGRGVERGQGREL